MNAGIKNAVIIGGGFAGMTAAARLARQGVEVDLLEVDPGWRSYGAGISLHGSTLRVLNELGLLDRFMEEGFASDGVELRGPDDRIFVTLPTPRVAGPDVPGGGGIMRPALAKILQEEVIAAGVNVRLGSTFSTIENREGGVLVGIDGASAQRYDLAIGADGLYSSVRANLFPEAPKPRFIGQSVWRAVLDRPAEINTVAMWLGPKLKVGLNGVSRDKAYLFLTEDKEVNDFVAPESFVDTLRSLLRKFPSPIIQTIANQLSADNHVIYRPLEQMLMPRPWRKGRVALIGDAVHATTPHLAAGACIGIEDAMVLAEEIGRAATAEEALAAFEARRWERCRVVVENSARLADIEIHGGSQEEHATIMRQSMKTLAETI